MNNFYSTLGLCMKAGLLVSGEFSVEKAIRSGQVVLVIIAKDASDNTKKKFRNMSTFRNLDYLEFGDKSSLAGAMGKEIRASIGITDIGFANNLKKCLSTNNQI